MGQTITFTDGVSVAVSAAASVYPPKPENWAIQPGKLYLVDVETPGGDGNRPATGRIMSQVEIFGCEQAAWEDVVGELAGKFKIASWGEDPPFGLENYWALLASSYYIQMANGGQTVDGRISPVWMAWHDLVKDGLDKINAGTRVLVDSTGKVIRPDPNRVGVLKIGISATPITIFAGEDSTSLDGNFVGGSLQEIQRLHGRASVSYNRKFPVSA